MSNTKYQRSIFTSKFNETFDITLTLPYLYFVYEVMLIYIYTHTQEDLLGSITQYFCQQVP